MVKVITDVKADTIIADRLFADTTNFNINDDILIRVINSEEGGSSNTTAISLNTANIATNASGISTNVTDIGINESNIAVNTTAIFTNLTNIGTNTSGISTNATDIGTNATDIGTNATNIGINTTDIGTNATNIGINTTDIGINTTNIGTNATDIGTNATNIGINTTDIGINTTNIGTNATDIGTVISALNDIQSVCVNVGGTFACDISGGTKVTLYTSIPNFLLLLLSDDEPAVNIVFRDEFSISPRFRISVEGAGVGASAFSQYYNVWEIPALTYLTFGSKIKCELIFTTNNFLICLINSIIIDAIPLGSEVQAKVPYQLVKGGEFNPDYGLIWYVEKFSTI
uniref:Uncharacterized protein n=1 Tax=viral metagenome TaxID=1070528 RepID=A0A6C0JB29_9ZZZZ